MTEIHVRYATLDDVERLAPPFDAYRVFYQQCSDLNLAQQFLRERLALGESVILLAESAGEAVGFIQLYPSFCSIAAARVWVLYDLFVSEAARGQGISRLLMDKASTTRSKRGRRGLICRRRIKILLRRLYTNRLAINLTPFIAITA